MNTPRRSRAPFLSEPKNWRRSGLTLAVLALTAVATACSTNSSNVLTLRRAEIDIENWDAVRDIAVETLDTTEPTCRPVGSTLDFPSGARVKVYE